MDANTRLAVTVAAVMGLQDLVVATVVYFVRRQKAVRPPWPWWKCLLAVFLLGLPVAAVNLVPVVGRFLAIVVLAVGLKRFTGLGVFSTVLLTFALGFLTFAALVGVGSFLGVDLLMLPDPAQR